MDNGPIAKSDVFQQEARNALARAVFFNRQGELRDRTFENQRYRASGLNLVVLAIILWNTVYLERAKRSWYRVLYFREGATNSYFTSFRFLICL